MGSTGQTPERRRHRRFSVSLELTYSTPAGEAGTGMLVNISSGGMLFRSEIPLRVGSVIEAELAWPSGTLESAPLRLRVHGIVIRSSGSAAAVSITKYDIGETGAPPTRAE